MPSEKKPTGQLSGFSRRRFLQSAGVVGAGAFVFQHPLLKAAAQMTSQVDASTRVGLDNGSISIQFDRHTGMLVSLTNLSTGDNYLKQGNGDGNPFRAYVDTKQVPKILAEGDPFPVQPVEGDLGGTLVDPKNCTLTKSSYRHQDKAGVLNLTIQSASPDLAFELEVTVPDKGTQALFNLTVRNSGQIDHHLMTAFPYLTGLSLGNNRDTNRGLQLQNLGHSRGRGWENEGDIHGRCWGGQWNAVHEPSLNEAFGVLILDKDFRNKAVLRHPGGIMSFFYFDNQVLKPGESISFPAAALLVNSGDWKPIARQYSQWFHSKFDVRTPPKWLDDVDMFVGAWIPPPEKVAEFKAKPDSFGSFTSFAQLPRLYLEPNRSDTWDQVGKYDVEEWAQWWQGVIRYKRYGAYHHVDGVYDYREDLGGRDALKEGVARVEQIGRVVGLYFASQTMRNDSIFFKEAFPGTTPQDWLRMETPDTKLPPPDPDGHQSFYMCMRYKPYQDYLAALIKKRLQETGVKYIRLDEFGGTFIPCHNPAHHHSDPNNSTPEILDFLRKIRAAIDEVNPEVAMFTETCVDTCSLFSDGCLSAWYAGPDIIPMRLLFPKYVLLAYHSGQIESALNALVTANVFSCNRGGFWAEYFDKMWGPGLEHKPKSYPEAKEWQWSGSKMRWHELGHTFQEAARHGDPTDINPIGIGQDPDEWTVRLWRSPNYWLMVCGNVAGLHPSSPVRVKLPELPDAVTSAYEFDFETLNMRPIPIVRGSDGIFVETNNGFSAVLFPQPSCPPLIKMDDPPGLTSDKPLELKLDLFSPWRKDQGDVQVSVDVPGLKVSTARLSLPGTLTISARPPAEGGWYYLTVSGDSLRLKRWFHYSPSTVANG